MDEGRTVPDELNPLVASDHIRTTYERYVQTTFDIEDACLHEQFLDLTTRKGFLTRGPFLEGTPPFRQARNLRELIREGVLSDGFEALDGPGFPANGFPIGRSLYAHQERSILKSLAGRNVVVASGTGSGKTEAFLVPIIDHLLGEREPGTLGSPGVRALLVYPMNALANDQLKRLRRLLACAPEITFGRYTGQTKERREEAETDFAHTFPDEPRVENELICREEIRLRPPHLFLTNYAMLEYLLLRPKDTSLFDGPTGQHWRFVVIDEAHTYSGAAGMEVGMLMRRLKDRVVKSEHGRLRCCATSATLGAAPMTSEQWPTLLKSYLVSSSSGLNQTRSVRTLSRPSSSLRQD